MNDPWTSSSGGFAKIAALVGFVGVLLAPAPEGLNPAGRRPTAATVLPILAGTAVGPGIDPRLIMIPATISTSCAFMLPIATPPNAIVFGSGKVRMSQMARHGILLNLLGVALMTAATFVFLQPSWG